MPRHEVALSRNTGLFEQSLFHVVRRAEAELLERRLQRISARATRAQAEDLVSSHSSAYSRLVFHGRVEASRSVVGFQSTRHRLEPKTVDVHLPRDLEF